MVNDDGYYMVNDYLMVIWLVVFRLPLWKILVNWDHDIPNIWKHTKMFQTTNQKCSRGCFGVSCYISLAFCREQLQTLHGLLNCQILASGKLGQNGANNLSSILRSASPICDRMLAELISTLAEQSDTNLVNLWFTSLMNVTFMGWANQVLSMFAFNLVASCLVFRNSFWRQQLMGS